MHGRFSCYSARETAQSVTRLEALAHLMDSALVIPGTNLRLGLDALLGFVPVAGDVISGLISSYLIWEARQLGAPPMADRALMPLTKSTGRSVAMRTSSAMRYSGLA